MVAILRRRSPADELQARVAEVRAKQPPERRPAEPDAEIIEGATVFLQPDRKRLVLVTRNRRTAGEAARAHTPSIVKPAPDGTYLVLELLGRRT